MTNKTVPVGEASAADLREFASVTLQIEDIPLRANRGQIIAKMEAAGFNGSHITVPDRSDDEAAHRIETTTDAAGRRVNANGDEICTIIIAKTDTPGGDEPFYGCINGNSFAILRGVPVDITVGQFEVIEHAMSMKWRSMSKGLEGAHLVPAYPVTRIA